MSTVEADYFQQIKDDERALRVLLWATHPCAGKYGDDGELQCQACRLDFKRDSIRDIEAGLQRRSLEWLATAQHQTCRYCGATRFTAEAALPCSLGSGNPHAWRRRAAELYREDATAFTTAARRLVPYRDRVHWTTRWLASFTIGFLNRSAERLRAFAQADDDATEGTEP